MDAVREVVGCVAVVEARVAGAAVEEAAGFPERELVEDGDCWGEFAEPAATAALGPPAIAPGLCGEVVGEEAAWPELGAAAFPAPVALEIPEPVGAVLVVTGPLPALLGPGAPTPLGTPPGLEFPGWPAPDVAMGVPVAGLITTPPLETGVTEGEPGAGELLAVEPSGIEDEDEFELGTTLDHVERGEPSFLPGMEESRFGIETSLRSGEEAEDGPRKSPKTIRCKGWSRRKNKNARTQSSNAAIAPMVKSRTRNRVPFAILPSFATAVVSETHEFLPQDGQVKRWASGCSSSAGWPQWMQRCFIRA